MVEGKARCMIHNPGYDFNDEVLPIGASYWAHLSQTPSAGKPLSRGIH